MTDSKRSRMKGVQQGKKPPSPPVPAPSAPASNTSAAPLFSLGKTNKSQSKVVPSPFHPTALFDQDSNVANGTNRFSFGATSNGTSKKEEPSPENGNTSIPTTDFDSYREQHIRPLMDLNDRVNALTYQETLINSTRIVVAGDQSHGKTSLLEALCGVDLPRGEGIQTRVPLVLQLRQAQDDDEYALIQVVADNALGGMTKHEERFALGQIGNKVREYTAIAAGKGKNISDTPIELKIFRKNQDDLTLVDLPGITRVALEDQAGGDGKALEQQIMQMCRKYMTPKESILLNVVSAMVDFSTSASLQLSHELDKERKRTMLCITKVDQHSEAGLHDKITKSIHNMNLKPQHVFTVRNRTQEENDENLPLSQVQRLENEKLEQLTEGRVAEYQLGVKALSKHLVKIQCEEILKTLPGTRNTIKRVAADLKDELEGLGEPVGDAAAGKARAVHLIDACTNRLEGEASGRVHTKLDTGSDNCEGEAFELLLIVDDFQSVYKKGKRLWSSSFETGEFSFKLHMDPARGDEESVGLYLHTSTKDDRLMEANVSVSCTFVVTQSDRELCRLVMDHTYTVSKEETSEGRGYGRGYSECLSPEEAKALVGEVSFSAHIYVDSVEVEEVSEEEFSALGKTLLCARLADLQDDFTSSIDTLYSNSHFFSQGFRKSLARELQGSRGGIGLPGNIASHVPVGVLCKLRTKLPDPIAAYRDKVLKECMATSEAVIESYVGIDERHPKLQSVLVECVNGIFNDQASELEEYHAKILEWEENVCSSNHYFMDTVNSIRSCVYDSEDEDDAKPLYLCHLTPEAIAAMSNEDQKLVDQQIEIFAYWKLMKKRLIDYILLSAQGDLVNTPIQKKLKTTMLDVVFRRGDAEMVELLSRDAHIEKKRANVFDRLVRLTEALQEIDEYKTKHPGGLVEL